ncbi:hypothetical protein NUW58_g9847 [Xylaria curta]|uniref:Uncharacterized protein n=1 Tax=Xylaria curta TaxID=42375 RepID=A0ACC1MUL2_9PEZI|nr:hypothetical protein NUW58_g9847 [Xylaria curta]
MLPRAQPVDADAAQQQQHDETTARMNSIIHEIRTLYDANTPLFTKDAIRKVGEELERCRKDAVDGRSVTLQGINGVDYEVLVSLPPIQYTLSEEQHVGGSTWVIMYNSIEHLTTERNVRTFSPNTAYLPMIIATCTRRIKPHPEENELHASSTEELGKAFHEIEQKWKTSEYYDKLQAALATVKTPIVLDKVIGVALGPLIIRTLVNRRSIIQHALISAIESILLQRGVLSVSSGRYVQDPVYTQRDRDVLCSAGFTILDDPQAFLTLDDSSILVSINPDIPVKQIVADICRPSIIIWPRKYDSVYQPIFFEGG